jgi:hypothetical protein
MESMNVWFGSGPGIVSPLEVEGPEGGASLKELCLLLFRMRVQVLRADEERRPTRVVHRLGVCEFDGGPLSPRRRRTIAREIAAASKRAA